MIEIHNPQAFLLDAIDGEVHHGGGPGGFVRWTKGTVPFSALRFLRLDLSKPDVMRTVREWVARL